MPSAHLKGHRSIWICLDKIDGMHQARRERMKMTHSDELSAYMTFGRSDWAALRSNTSLTLSDADISALRGLNEPITSAEVADVYLPLTRLLNLHFSAARNLMHVKAEFLGRPTRGSPYIIALARAPLPACFVRF